MLPWSPELETALEQAKERAAARGEDLSTLDVLAGLLEQDTPRRIVGALALPLFMEEPAGQVERMVADSERLAARCGAAHVEALHVLAILCRQLRSGAHGVLVAAGCDPTRIRAAALREQIAPPARRRLRREPETGPTANAPATTSAPSAAATTVAAAGPPAAGEPDERACAMASGRDLTAAARAGQLERLIGREKELFLLADVLAKRESAIACLVGEAGTGKTALVRGLAGLLARKPSALPALAGMRLLEVPPQAAPRDVFRKGTLLFYDFAPPAETLFELGQLGASAIVAITPVELRRLVEAMPVLAGRFTQILLAEPSPEETLAILRACHKGYEAHHHVTYQADALEAAARLSIRYVSDRHLPDRALGLLDLAGARARRLGRKTLSAEEVAAVVAEAADVPIDRLLARDAKRLLEMEHHLAQTIVGHGDILTRIAAAIRRNYAGFRAKRPVGSFLFLGPTGVGKTETAKALAAFLMGSHDFMIRLDMSEYMESHQVSRLIGSPPGYIGYEEGGQLIEAVRRRPDTVVLLDEIEKAHPDLLPILLQILDEGRLTDGRGRTVDFSNTVVVMTSNLGAGRRGQEILAAARRAFPIELWNRIEEAVVFAPLGPQEVAEVARRLARASSERLARERGIRYELDDGAVSYLLKHGGFDRELGARPMRAALSRLIETPLADAILGGEVQAGEAVRVGRQGGRLKFETI